MPNYQSRLKLYCQNIKSGKIPSGEWTKRAINRFLSDLKRTDLDYKYHPDLADEVMEFAESLDIPDIDRADGTKNLLLNDWHIFIYANIWGWRAKHDSTKLRFRMGYAEVARKNSKTTSILFPFILWDFIQTSAAESYFVSKDEAQSRKSYKELAWIIKNNRDLSKVVSETVSALTFKNSRIAFFSSESTAIDSYKNSLSIIDEYHAYTSDKIVTAFRYGGRSKKNSLVMIITSAGNDISGPCYSEAERCKSILAGNFTDENYFGIIYCLDDKDDWKDSKNFIKANPSLNQGFLPEDVLMKDLTSALTKPSEQPDFKAKTCGIWSHSVTSWIPLQVWERANKPQPDVQGLDCFGAIDLSNTMDFTAWTLYFKSGDTYIAKHRFWIPADTIQERFKNENINILEWISSGLLTVIPGPVIDYEIVYSDIKSDILEYKPKGIHFDNWNSQIIVARLEEDFEDLAIPFKQNLINMSAPTKSWESAVYNGQIIDSNPIMKWMVPNTEIKPDPNGNYKPLKSDIRKNTKRIDGVITSIMAFDGISQCPVSTNPNIEDILALF